jgi:hypothetical protein
MWKIVPLAPSKNIQLYFFDIIVNFIVQTLKSKHTSLKKYTNSDKLSCLNFYIFWGNKRKYFSHILGHSLKSMIEQNILMSCFTFYFSIYCQNMVDFKAQLIEWQFNSTKNMRKILPLPRAGEKLVRLGLETVYRGSPLSTNFGTWKKLY